MGKRCKRKAKNENVYYINSNSLNIIPKNKRQEEYINSMRLYQLSFATGSAGTGKTYCATAYAAQCYKKGLVKKIILGRPAEPTGRSIGYFPGDINDKLYKWLIEPIDTLRDILGKGEVEYMLRTEKLILEPLETCRGRSYEDAFVIVDEAQNLNMSQLVMMTTRIGENTKMVVCGDNKQTDFKQDDFGKFTELLKSSDVECGVTEFQSDDIVRSGIVRDIVKLCEEHSIF